MGLLVLSHTFWKVISLTHEEVNHFWMLINKVHALKLAVRRRKRRGKDGKPVANLIQKCVVLF